MIDSKLMLYLPFDDPQGNKAYDFSQYRADATLTAGADFSRNAKRGKSLSLNGYGECSTPQVIPFDSDFTLCMYILPVTDRLGWMLNFEGINKFQDQWISVVPGRWEFIAFVKDGDMFQVYRNADRVYNEALLGTPVGFSLNDHHLGGTTAQIDEVKLYSVAKSPKEIFTMQKDLDVEYYIDGRNFKEFGVYVTKSSGLNGRLERKEALQVDWDNYHGTVRDKKRPRYKSREITLGCMIEASGRSAFVEWCSLFFNMFDGAGNHRLKIEYDGNTKPLEYEVELLDEVDPEKQWGTYSNETMVGTFTLKLVEDEPVKKVLRHIGTAAKSVATITTTSSKLLNIYWGDGTHTYNVSGTDKTVEHTYEQPGEYDIIVTGVIEEIEKFSTNAIVIWDILK